MLKNLRDIAIKIGAIILPLDIFVHYLALLIAHQGDISI
jgi:hypothetical protein